MHSIWQTYTLGEFIRELSRCDNLHATIEFDFGSLSPTSFRSYRGFYEHLALGYSNKPTLVYELLAKAERALTDTFNGYKGGAYLMDEDTPIWVSEPGNVSGTTIVDFTRPSPNWVIINTSWTDH